MRIRGWCARPHRGSPSFVGRRVGLSRPLPRRAGLEHGLQPFVTAPWPALPHMPDGVLAGTGSVANGPHHRHLPAAHQPLLHRPVKRCLAPLRIALWGCTARVWPTASRHRAHAHASPDIRKLGCASPASTLALPAAMRARVPVSSPGESSGAGAAGAAAGDVGPADGGWAPGHRAVRFTESKAVEADEYLSLDPGPLVGGRIAKPGCAARVCERARNASTPTLTHVGLGYRHVGPRRCCGLPLAWMWRCVTSLSTSSVLCGYRPFTAPLPPSPSMHPSSLQKRRCRRGGV
jgi:hypothetical protein